MFKRWFLLLLDSVTHPPIVPRVIHIRANLATNMGFAANEANLSYSANLAILPVIAASAIDT